MQNEPVDVASDANESMSEESPSTPTSDGVEDDGILLDLKFYVYFSLNFVVGFYVLNVVICIISVSLNGNVSDHCFGNIPVVMFFSFKFINQ